MERDSTQTQVVIVGAGPAGLAVGGCLRRQRIPFVLLERHEQVASAWRHHYERLHLHTTKRFSSLPYMRYPASAPRYPSRQQVIDYLEAYAQRIDLQPQCGQEVRSVQRKETSWEVQTEQGRYTAQCVVLATGLNEAPSLPTWADEDRFQGPVLHSAQYRSGEPFRRQRVLVIGYGLPAPRSQWICTSMGRQLGWPSAAPLMSCSATTTGFLSKCWLLRSVLCHRVPWMPLPNPSCAPSLAI